MTLEMLNLQAISYMELKMWPGFSLFSIFKVNVNIPHKNKFLLLVAVLSMLIARTSKKKLQTFFKGYWSFQQHHLEVVHLATFFTML